MGKKTESVPFTDIMKIGMLNYYILESMDDWVRVVTEDHTVVFANRKMKEHFGDDLNDKNCCESLRRTNECVFCISKKCIESGRPVEKEEVIDGRCYSVKASPVFDNTGKAVCAVEVFRDISRERNLELELHRRNQTLERDFELAKRIQKKILPTRKRYGNLTMNFIYEASESLSGDIFDIFNIGKNQIGMYVADVAGHGIAASMMTMFVRQAMRSLKEYVTAPAAALKELYERFRRLDLEVDKYFTCFYAIYNMETNKLTYANAGHNCMPIVYNDERVEMLKISGYPIFNLLRDVEYEEGSIYFNRSDKLLLYTDGLIENKDDQGVFFGVDGLLRLVEMRPKNLLQEIELASQETRWGALEDDYAAILIERL